MGRKGFKGISMKVSGIKYVFQVRVTRWVWIGVTSTLVEVVRSFTVQTKKKIYFFLKEEIKVLRHDTSLGPYHSLLNDPVHDDDDDGILSFVSKGPYRLITHSRV